jgi:predicted dehydrogenase
MEALWPPFQPLYIKTRELLESGEPGAIIHLNAAFHFRHLLFQLIAISTWNLGVVLFSISGYIR